GERIQFDGASYHSYTCNPSDSFEDFTWCQRTAPRRTSLGNARFSSSIMHAGDGTAVYLMANVTPVSINKNVVQTEIEALARELNDRPTKVEWLPQRSGIPGAVIALWGKVELQKLDKYDIEAIAAGVSPRRASVLVDHLGDMTRSATTGLPIYRIVGGAG